MGKCWVRSTVAEAVAGTLQTAGVNMCFSSIASGYTVTHHPSAGVHPWCWLFLDHDVLAGLRWDRDLPHFRPSILMSAETTHFLCVFHGKAGAGSESFVGGVSNPLNPKEEKGFLLEAPVGSTCLQPTDQRQE